MGYQSDLDNLRSQSGHGMGDIRDSYERSKDQYYTNSGNPMGYLDTNYQQQNLGRYVPPMLTGGPGSNGGWNGDGYGQGATGPYNYNIPTAFGGYGNGGYGNYGNVQSAPPLPQQMPQQPMGQPPQMGGMGRPHSFRPPPMQGNPQPGMNGQLQAGMQNRMQMEQGAIYGGSGPRSPLAYPATGTASQMPAGLPQASAVGAPPVPGLNQARQYSGAMPSTGVVQPPPPVLDAAPSSDPGDWMSNYYNQYRRQRMGWQNQ